MNTFRFSNLSMILVHFVILNFQTFRILTSFLQLVMVVVFLEIAVLLKLARMSLRFMILLSLRG